MATQRSPARHRAIPSLSHRVRCLPVRDTNTSSSVALCVVSRLSVACRWSQHVEQRRNGAVHFRGRRARRCHPRAAHRCTPGSARSSSSAGSVAPSATANWITCSAPSDGDERRRRAERDQPAVVHDADAVAERVRLVHVVRRDQDGAAGFAEPLEHAPELPPRLRVEAGRRLVEKQQVGTSGHGAGHRQALLLAARQLADPRVRLRFELDDREQFVDGRPVADRTSGTAAASLRR